jgi:signal recognition particle subunit SRP54
MSSLMKMLPESLLGGMGLPQLTDEQNEQIETQMKRTEAIIDSMTRQERQNYKIIDASRKTRIANGSGTTIADVNALLKQYAQMREMMSQMNRSGLLSNLAGGMGGNMMRKMGGLFGGGMPSMGGLGGLFGGGDDYDNPPPISNRIKKKKRHKKKR